MTPVGRADEKSDFERVLERFNQIFADKKFNSNARRTL